MFFTPPIKVMIMYLKTSLHISNGAQHTACDSEGLPQQLPSLLANLIMTTSISLYPSTEIIHSCFNGMPTHSPSI
jgi:hypothetical protein